MLNYLYYMMQLKLNWREDIMVQKEYNPITNRQSRNILNSCRLDKYTMDSIFNCYENQEKELNENYDVDSYEAYEMENE